MINSGPIYQKTSWERGRPTDLYRSEILSTHSRIVVLLGNGGHITPAAPDDPADLRQSVRRGAGTGRAQTVTAGQRDRAESVRAVGQPVELSKRVRGGPRRNLDN